MKYEIEYELDGHKCSNYFIGSSPGEAFAKCLLKVPKCKLLRAIKTGLYESGRAEWKPPPVQRMPVDERVD